MPPMRGSTHGEPQGSNPKPHEGRVQLSSPSDDARPVDNPQRLILCRHGAVSLTIPYPGNSYIFDTPGPPHAVPAPATETGGTDATGRPQETKSTVINCI